MGTPTGIAGRVALRSELSAVAEVVWGHWEPATRAARFSELQRAAAELQQEPLAWVLGAPGQVTAAALAQIQPGRTAHVWPAAGRPGSALADLLAGCLAELARRQVVLAQSLLESDETAAAAQLAVAGFQHLTELVYMVDLSGGVPAETQPPELPGGEPAGARLVPVGDTPGEWSRLARLIEQTYLGTRDCPQLNGVRDPADVLAGYAGVAPAAARHWCFAVENGADVGCLLLAEHADSGLVELVYMGLVRAARGRGLGDWLLAHASRFSRSAGRRGLIVAVDAHNEPALAVYKRAGLECWQQRAVWVRVLERGRTLSV